MMNTTNYMRGIHAKLKDTKDKYHFAKVTGTSNMEEVIMNRKDKYFFAVDDSNDGVTKYVNDSPYDHRPTTVFILTKLKGRYPDMKGREEAIAEAKVIYKKILSKLRRDHENGEPGLEYLDDEIPYYEVPMGFADGCGGIYFQFRLDIPDEIIYNTDDWTE